LHINYLQHISVKEDPEYRKEKKYLLYCRAGPVASQFAIIIIVIQLLQK